MDSVMSVEYSAIRPRFQAVSLSRQQRLSQIICGALLHLSKLGRAERGIRMERFQWRMQTGIGHFHKLVTVEDGRWALARFYITAIKKGA
jgi:hypothetical protein